MSAPAANVLFDAPGPKTRRRVLALSVVAALFLAVLLIVVVQRFASQGQLRAELWGPLLDPSTDEFSLVWDRLLSGLWLTVRAAVFAMVGSLVIGVLVAAVRLGLGKRGKIPLVVVVELLRGLPVVVTIFLVSAVLPSLGIELPLFWYLVIGLVLYNSVIISEIVRAGVVALPRGQVEAGKAIGLTGPQVMMMIQLPQAIRLMLPAIISQLVVIIKDTALASIALNGLQDILWQGDRMRGVLDNPLQMYLVIGVIFILMCLALDRFAQWTERRLSTGGAKKSKKSKAADAVEPAVEARAGA